MKVVFKKTGGDWLEATLLVDGIEIIAMDEFGGNSHKAGDEIEVCFSVGLHFDGEPWESMFSGNPEGKKALEHQTGWRYRAYGVVTSIDPEVMVDVGFSILSAPIVTNDPRVIGASVAFTIERLDAQSC